MGKKKDKESKEPKEPPVPRGPSALELLASSRPEKPILDDAPQYNKEQLKSE